jgi:hypothetical protein
MTKSAEEVLDSVFFRGYHRGNKKQQERFLTPSQALKELLELVEAEIKKGKYSEDTILNITQIDPIGASRFRLVNKTIDDTLTKLRILFKEAER